MKNLETEIYRHDTEIEVTHKLNTIELDYWIGHLKYVKKEMINLIGICKKDLNKDFDDERILQKLQKKYIESETLLNALLKYKDSRESILECEDAQCDMDFVVEHENYRRSYLYHLDKYRRLKYNFFRKTKDRFTLLNKIA